MMEEICQTPKIDLTNEMENVRRPVAITIVCIIGFIGALVSVALILSGVAKSIGAWYTIYLAFASIIGLVCFVGFWKMRRIAVFIYASFVGLNQIIMLSTGIWSIGALLFPGVIVALTVHYSNRMK